jgi:hypothetical protein
LDLGTTIKDDLVPLALEYYLNVIPQEEADGSDDDMESDGSDEDVKPAPKKGGKGKGGPVGSRKVRLEPTERRNKNANNNEERAGGQQTECCELLSISVHN